MKTDKKSNLFFKAYVIMIFFVIIFMIIAVIWNINFLTGGLVSLLKKFVDVLGELSCPTLNPAYEELHKTSEMMSSVILMCVHKIFAAKNIIKERTKSGLFRFFHFADSDIASTAERRWHGVPHLCHPRPQTENMFYSFAIPQNKSFRELEHSQTRHSKPKFDSAKFCELFCCESAFF